MSVLYVNHAETTLSVVLFCTHDLQYKSTVIVSQYALYSCVVSVVSGSSCVLFAVQSINQSKSF